MVTVEETFEVESWGIGKRDYSIDVRAEILGSSKVEAKTSIDTSDTSERDIEFDAKGFMITDVGGGFDYKLITLDPNTGEKRYNPNSSWLQAQKGQIWEDIELKGIRVKGSGTSGTAKIIYWGRG